MILSGRQIQALLGATLVYAHVPFADTPKVDLSEGEVRATESARATLLAAKRRLMPPEPRTPSTWPLMLDDQTEVVFSAEEAQVLVRIVEACLAELRVDVELSAQAGPGVGLAALRESGSIVKAYLDAVLSGGT